MLCKACKSPHNVNPDNFVLLRFYELFLKLIKKVRALLISPITRLMTFNYNYYLSGWETFTDF